MEETEKRLRTIAIKVKRFLNDASVKTYWGTDQEPNYTIMKTGPRSCKIMWDDGVELSVSEDDQETSK